MEAIPKLGSGKTDFARIKALTILQSGLEWFTPKRKVVTFCAPAAGEGFAIGGVSQLPAVVVILASRVRSTNSGNTITAS